MDFRKLGKSGPFPDWVRKLRGKSGVYVIRTRDEFGFPVVQYVGESHTGIVD